ncbi:MAG: hypothetical protein GY719_31910 [bacterium]|nr:hypothetical protein [bacterium]
MSRENWRCAQLGELVDSSTGLQTGPYGSQLHAADYVSKGIPVIMPRDLTRNEISSARVKRVTPEKAAELERYQVRTGDIVLARRGKIGRCALVSPEEEGWLCGTGSMRVRPAPAVRSDFLSQLLQWPTTVAWLEENAVGQTMRNLNTRILSELPLRMPPPRIQRRIAEVLASIDTTITATRRVIEQNGRIQQGFMRDLLACGVGSSGSLRRGDERCPPRGWTSMRLGDLCSFTNGRGFKASEWSSRGLPIIRIQNLNGSNDFKYYDGNPRERWIVDAGELLFAWAGVRGVSFGPRIWRGPRGVLNQHIYRVRPRQKVAKAWLYECLGQVTRKIEDRAQGFKSSLLHIRKADIVNHQVDVPPYDVQLAIAERSAFVTEMETIERSNLDGLVRLKRALMSDLFTGRVTP